MICRDYPGYALERVHELASRQAVQYQRPGRVETDIDNLGYTLDDVCACLRALESEDFRESVQYTPGKRWHDVYRLRWRSRDGATDPLYIQFHLGHDCLVLILCSFHRDR